MKDNNSEDAMQGKSGKSFSRIFPIRTSAFEPTQMLWQAKRAIYYLNSESPEGTRMGHYCRICGRERPNEQFSGKGHRIHVCKRCNAKPKSERQVIEDKDDIFGFMHQSHISERNVARLEQMTKSENPQVASLAAIVLKVARVTPYKTRRLKFLAQMHPELLRSLENTGLVLAQTRDWETTKAPSQANSEEADIFALEDLEATDLSVQEDWEIPF
jgi:hypothetical protein